MDDLEVDSFLESHKEKCNTGTDDFKPDDFKKLLEIIRYILDNWKIQSGTCIELKQYIPVLESHIKGDSEFIDMCCIVNRVVISKNMDGL
ncbi:MAG: hypothetical protein IPM74_12570 [Crocinitomicaceae bacterium]|nr:hypothetical protein [Crocinitomicaceae bacterium]MBK8926709.1 hypothetical protein [Crocinitomicaceae bacterium]